jgi:hypothetical protein
LEVGQTGGAEVVGHLGGLGAVVAEHDAEQERASAVRQVGGAALEGSAQAVRRPAHGGAGLPGVHLVDGEAAHDPPGDEPVPPRPERRRGPAELDALARQPGLEVRPGRAVGHGLQPSTAGRHHHPHPAAVEAVGIVDQHDPALQAVDVRRVEPGEGPVAEAGGRERDREHQQRTAAHQESARADGGTHPHARPAADPGPDDGGQRHGEDRRIGEHEPGRAR